VEAVLERLLPEDVTCCVVDMPDPVKGARIVAVVTQEVDGAALLKQMSAELPNIALPKQFFVIDDLPTMGSGKADFRAIREKVRHMLGH
jgi:acyl-[acyl-carrier-protein]-phospholipid O-acyltransferase/long-chain-fatty-acid--[acyl-carrier-protein] ligase